MKKISIVGAGIGGLTTAIALIQQGFQVEIFESRPGFKKSGAGINLAINAMKVYKRLNVYPEVLAKASHTHTMRTVTKNLKTISTGDFQKIEKETGVRNAAIHRAALHEVLLKNIGDPPVHLNKKLRSLEQSNGKVILEFEDGSFHSTDILIGADGIHSSVRKSIFKGTELRDAKQVCWRGICRPSIAEKYRHELNEMWAKGKRFGFVHIDQEQVYWFALIDKKKFSHREINLSETFSDCHPIILKILEITPPEDIIFNEIWDLKKLDQWHSGNVCLVGDAAHATTPNMGQGAGQAIESAMALSLCLKKYPETQRAFRKYQEIRKEKADYIIDTSWKIGKLAQSSNPVLIAVRNFVSPMVPKPLTGKLNRKVFDLNF